MIFQHKFTNDHPIHLGLQPKSTDIPSDFQFTALFAFNTTSLFSSFGFENLIAAGTQEGTILLLSKELEPVSLLCGHQSEITDIILSVDPKFMISISYDAELVIWSLDDGTAVAKFNLKIKPNKYRISRFSQGSFFIWVWSVNETPVLVNLQTGEIVFSFPYVGLTNFGTISSTNFSVLRFKCLVCVTNMFYEVFKFYENFKLELVSRNEFDSNSMLFPCNCGFIKLTANSFSLIQPETSTVILNRELPK